MKKFFRLGAVCALVALVYFSCRKTANVSEDGVPQAVLQKLKEQGYRTDHVIRYKSGYVVEGDIYITEDQLNNPGDSKKLRVVKNEQYRTTNLVTPLPRVITVSVSNLSSAFDNGIDDGLARYNALGLGLTFSRVSSGADISIIGYYDPFGPIAYGGFPDSYGNPYNTIYYNTYYLGSTPDRDFLATLTTHEIGHCIGLRHTDYFDRSNSCGGSPVNEGAGTDGAIWIPGTNTGYDASSVMVSCVPSLTTNIPFSTDDIAALNYLYGPYIPRQNGTCSGISSNYTILGSPGDVFVVRVNFSGFIKWNNLANGTGATISMNALGNWAYGSTSHDYSSFGTGFSTSATLTITLSSNYVTVYTNNVLNNSSYNSSSSASLTLVSVNGNTVNAQVSSCYGNSGGSW